MICRSYSMDQIIGQALTEFRRIEESVSHKERRELCLQVEGPSPPPPERLRACRKRERAFVHGSLAIPDQLAASALEPAHDPVRYRRQAEAALQG